MQQNKIFKTPSLKTKAYCKVMILRNKENPKQLKGKEYNTENTYVTHTRM